MPIPSAVGLNDPDAADLAVLRLLEVDPSLTQRDLSKALGSSLGKAHYLLKALLAKGWVKMKNFQRSDNKMAYAYQLTPRGVAERARLTRAFLARKELEFELLKSEIRSLKNQVEADNKSQSPARNDHKG